MFSILFLAPIPDMTYAHAKVMGMGARENLQKLADKKRDEIADLQTQIERANVYLQAIQDSIKVLPRESHAAAAVDEPAAVLRSGTMLAKAREAIIQNGAPLHVNRLLASAGVENTKNARVSLVGSLGTYVRKGIIFTRPGPNIFGLVGMENQTTEGAEVSLPDTFGTFTEGD